jgi:hypothetical protein
MSIDREYTDLFVCLLGIITKVFIHGVNHFAEWQNYFGILGFKGANDFSKSQHYSQIK